MEVTEVITGRMFTFHAVNTFINIGPLRAGNLYSCRVAAFTIALGPFTARFTVRSVETGKYGSKIQTNMSVWLKLTTVTGLRVITLRDVGILIAIRISLPSSLSAQWKQASMGATYRLI